MGGTGGDGGSVIWGFGGSGVAGERSRTQAHLVQGDLHDVGAQVVLGDQA